MSNYRKCSYHNSIGNWTVQHHLKNEEKTNLAFWADCTTCFNRRKETRIPNFPQVLLLISMFFFPFSLIRFEHLSIVKSVYVYIFFFQIMLQRHLLLVCETSAILYSNCFAQVRSTLIWHTTAQWTNSKEIVCIYRCQKTGSKFIFFIGTNLADGKNTQFQTVSNGTNTMDKTEIIYTKNMGASIAMNLT